MSSPLAYDGSYCRSVGGVLKISCLLSSVLGFCCILFSPVQIKNLRGISFLVITLFGFICTAFVLMAQLLQVWQRKFYYFHYVRFEMFLHVFLACVYFIVSGTTLTLDVLGYTIAAFFGLLGFSFYAYDAYLGYLLSRKADVSTQTTTV